MAVGSSTKRYAQAAFDMAVTRNQVDALAQELRLIIETLENGDFKMMLEHAKVPLARKVSVIEAVLPGISPLGKNLLSLLVARGLVHLLPKVEREYILLVDRHHGRERVQVYSAVPLEENQKEQITKVVEVLVQKEVVLDARVDTAILGGLVLRVGDKLLDGSIRTRLLELKKTLQHSL